MTKFNLLLPMAAAALLLTACSSDDVVDSVETQKHAISFNVTQDNSLSTRASTPITSSNLTSTDFEVWAFNNGEVYMGSTVSDGTRIRHFDTDPGNGTSAAATDGYGSGYWDYATAEKVQYWPGSTLNFFAISPAHDGTTATGGVANASAVTPNVSNTAKTFTYYADASNDNQLDVMVATASATSSPVTLNFRHALSQIVFMGQVSSTNLKATITNIKLYNIKNGGTCTFDDSNISWADVDGTGGTTATTYTATPSSTSALVNSTSATAITGEGGISATVIDPLLLMPQSFSGSGSVTTSQPSSGAYLDVTYVLQDAEDKYVKGSASEPTHAYVPLSTDWVAGNKYIYTFTFSAKAITFTCTVNGWTDTTVNSNGEQTM